jgi:hypothetical protein
MIQLPENIVAIIRKDATEISVYQALVKEANETRDKLWKSIKVCRCGDCLCLYSGKLVSMQLYRPNYGDIPTVSS